MNEPPPPWAALDALPAELETMQPCVRGSVHPLAVVDGVLSLGEGSVIKAGTVIEGFVRIGSGCVIGPNAYLRGHCIVGNGCRIGHAVEVKSSIIGDGSAISHLCYVGDSILGEDVNLGGGCILSNFRHDAGEIRMLHGGQLKPTGRDKLGCVIGAHSRLGCNTVVLPGRILPPHTRTFPGSTVRGEGDCMQAVN